MAKKSVIRLPNGISIEITPDFKPDQINAIITSVMSGQSFSQPNKIIKVLQRDAVDVWNSSKKEKVALFIRNYFSPTLWFSAKEVLEEQLMIVRSIVFGETSQINTYLKRLNDEKYVDRRNIGRKVNYRINQKLIDEYPTIALEKFNELILETLQ